MDALTAHLQPELVGFVLTLALGLLIGFEREESRPDGTSEVFFGGVRTYPLMALGGFLLVLAFPDSALPFAAGLLVLGALLAVTLHAGKGERDFGITSEVAALLTFTLGAAAATRHYWIAIASGVLAVMLLQEKQRLEGLADRVPRHEVATLIRFLLITGVILPVVPNHPFTAFELNPFKTWLVVVAVSGVSYASYLLQHLTPGGLTLTALLGGAYSSTVTTVVLARQSRSGRWPHRAVTGAIVAATGMMYLRLWVLVILFSPAIAHHLTIPFLSLAAVAVVGGVLLTRAGGKPERAEPASESQTNPLELTSAFAFAAIFVAVLVLTRLVAERFGGAGVLVMAGIMGAADVDPFILGLTQYAGGDLAIETAALAVVIAAAANNLMKGIYAWSFGAREAGQPAFLLLVLLGLASLGLFLL